jgi:hypothetical protein
MEEYNRLFEMVFGRKSTTTDFAGASAYIPIDQLEVLVQQPENWEGYRQKYEAWKKHNVQACMSEERYKEWLQEQHQ